MNKITAILDHISIHGVMVFIICLFAAAVIAIHYGDVTFTTIIGGRESFLDVSIKPIHCS